MRNTDELVDDLETEIQDLEDEVTSLKDEIDHLNETLLDPDDPHIFDLRKFPFTDLERKMSELLSTPADHPAFDEIRKEVTNLQLQLLGRMFEGPIVIP